MDQKNAIKLLDNTFNQDFAIDRFSLFIKELFNHFNLRINENIPLRKEYYNYINQMDSLGVYRDNNGDSIEVFAVQLKETSSRDRARTMQRNLIAKYLKNSGSNAALVAFYGDDPQDWRFSFVRIEYDLIKDEKGNLKVKEDITPARRSSFLVGKNEPNHTCRRQFLSLIKEENVDPLLEQLEEAFSIESVTKEFFEEYKKLFLKLKESLEKVIENDDVVKNEFKKKSIPTLDFAKKLMGQIVFIYFLQKKGWLGVDKGEKWGNGPRNFLRKLFNKEMIDYDNFFNDILEPLFYEAFATPRDNDYYRHFDCKIPFLNGGLFEPINEYDWVKTEITLNNQIFEEILDVFDLYNFTIKEDEPLEKEVAVDPEMLGKVFENLLEVKDRKSKGAFYTPREIVHYMCQESLINYLNTNSRNLREDIERFIHLGDFALDLLIREIIEFGKLREDREYGLPISIKENYKELDALLQQIKVVDPAVGSGAFPVGMMYEIVKARSILSFLSGETKSNYQLKLETIRDSLYGVDIDSSAVDIAKLRFWLSLIVDEDDIEKIDPLPNLDHKIMCGNSLLDEFKGKKLFDDNLVGEFPTDNFEEVQIINKKIEDLYHELGKIHTGKTKVKDESRKETINSKIKKLEIKKKKLRYTSKDEFQQFTLDDDYYRLKVKESQVKLKELKKLQKLFFKEQNTKLKKKYRREIEKIEWEFIEETLHESGNEKSVGEIEHYKKIKSKPFFLWKLYFSEVFQGDRNGFDIVIGNPPYVNIEKLSKEEKKSFLRIFGEKGKLGKRYDLYQIFIMKGLELLSIDGTLSFILPNTFLMGSSYTILRKKLLIDSLILRIVDLPQNVFKSATVDNVLLFLKKKNPNLDQKNTVKINILKNNSSISKLNSLKWDESFDLEQNSIMNIENYKINIHLTPRLKTLFDKVENETVKLGEITESSQGIIIYKTKKDSEKNLHTSFQRKKGWKKLLRGKNIGLYHIKWGGEYINYGDWLWSQRKSKFFESPKILLIALRNKSLKRRLVGTYDEEKYYNAHNLANIIQKENSGYNLKYIMGIFNSKLINFWYKFHYPNVNINPNDFRQIPIKVADKKTQETMINLVTNIYNKTKEEDYLENSEKQLKVKMLKNHIDDEVYKLYNLNSDEIALIEEFYNNLR